MGISVNDLLKIYNKIENKDKVIVLDCCHSTFLMLLSGSDAKNKLFLLDEITPYNTLKRTILGPFYFPSPTNAVS
jgi:hypothetical protein